MVTVLIPRKLVRVEPDKLNADDILDFGAALIETHGWMQNDSGDAKRGWSIHGALGEAAKRATRSHAKDDNAARRLRDRANAQIRTRWDLSDIQLNDGCTTKDEAVQKMLDAKGATP